ncbi:NmrA family NAD(P)-binding protein [Halocola ammonii]
MKNKNALILGATGNVGSEVIKSLLELKSEIQVIAAVRDIEKSREQFDENPRLDFVRFDFDDQETFETALKGVDVVFVLRPPHISDVNRVFAPLIDIISKVGSGIVFLSVQGVEKSSIIPHYKIEKLIREADIPYVFVRPSYFMQNLSTTLLRDIQEKKKIILPAGHAKFLWVDTADIGRASAVLIDEFDRYKNRAFEITGTEKLNFHEVCQLLTEETGSRIDYTPVNPLRFYAIKSKEGMKSGFILVMIMLHFLPRFQKEPAVSTSVFDLTGRKPNHLREFIQREKAIFKVS